MRRSYRLCLIPVIASLIFSCNPRDKTAEVQSVSLRSRSSLEQRVSPIPDAESASAQLDSKTPTMQSLKPSLQPRMVVKTAELSLEVVNYDQVFTQVQKIVADHDGFVVASTINTRETKHIPGRVTLRVPSKKFDETLRQIKSLARKVENEEIKGNDVTEEFYDVSARLINKQKAEKRYQEILSLAKNVNEVLEVETAITGVREEIERLTARRQYLHDQSELSTINISLHEPFPIPVPVPVAARAGFWSRMADAAKRGFESFTDVLSVTITLLIAYSPIFVMILLALITVFKYRKLSTIRPDRIQIKATTKRE